MISLSVEKGGASKVKEQNKQKGKKENFREKYRYRKGPVLTINKNKANKKPVNKFLLIRKVNGVIVRFFVFVVVVVVVVFIYNIYF